MHLLFPGRHHLLTNFQQDYLNHITNTDAKDLRDADNNPLGLEGKIDNIIWAVTSANHSNTIRNPLPAHRREGAIETFATQLDAESFVYMIDDLGRTPKFAEYLLKKIEVDSKGKFRLTPENTILGCSTPEVINMYEKLGFKVLPFELVDRKKETYCANRPWDLINLIVKAGKDWRKDQAYLAEVAPATRKMFEKYDIGDLIVELHNDPLVGEDGDITETRDYNTYVRSFDEGAKRKFDALKQFMLPGRIVDIGCCTGGLIREMTLDDRFRESDFYGVEIARELFTRCIERKAHGYFNNDNVFFHQRNIARGKIFEDNSVNTTTTVALTHELESYQGRKTLLDFIAKIYEQTAIGGRWLNLDVVGPENSDETVYMRLNQEDGSNEDAFKECENSELKNHLAGLSTHARFLRFAKDFRHEEGYQMQYETENVGGTDYIKLKMGDACEFMSKKDYTDNWQSEMHEAFCFWSISDWKKAIEDAGFKAHPESKAFRNEWIVDNRFKGKVELYQMQDGKLDQMEYPVTNMVLVGEK